MPSKVDLRAFLPRYRSNHIADISSPPRIQQTQPWSSQSQLFAIPTEVLDRIMDFVDDEDLPALQMANTDCYRLARPVQVAKLTFDSPDQLEAFLRDATTAMNPSETTGRYGSSVLPAGASYVHLLSLDNSKWEKEARMSACSRQQSSDYLMAHDA